MTISRLYSVPGMSCDNCVNAITDHVTPLDGVTDLEFDLDARTVTITGGDDAAITAAIDEAGFVIRCRPTARRPMADFRMAEQWHFCGKCGGQVTPIDRFCPWCGHELGLPEE